MSANVYVGLDIETSGTDLKDPVSGLPYRTIQIGVAFGALDVVVSDIGYSTGSYAAHPEAMAVNGFTPERIEAAPRQPVVDAALAAMCQGRELKEKALISVGWNVAGFDLKFVTCDLPEFSKYLAYRTVDLNAVCFTLGEATSHRWEKWKKWSKDAAAKLLGTEDWHDAGYDAIASLVSWRWLAEQVTTK